jgi:hypothetical protein
MFSGDTFFLTSIRLVDLKITSRAGRPVGKRPGLEEAQGRK